MHFRAILSVVAAAAFIGCADQPTGTMHEAPGAPALSNSEQLIRDWELKFSMDWENHTYGLTASHPDFYLPAGEYDLDIEVTGGISIDADLGTRMGLGGARFVGPGGNPQAPKPVYTPGDRGLAVSVVREFVRNGLVRTEVVWTAPPNDSETASGKIRIHGPARLYFKRSAPIHGEGYMWNWTSSTPWQPFSRHTTQNQRGKLVATPYSEEPTLHVACTLPLVERGAKIECHAQVFPAQPATLLSRSASGTGFQFEERPNTPIRAGDTTSWEGRAVATTRVRFTAEVTHEGRKKQLTQEASFSVQPRSWQPYELARPPYHEIELRGAMTAYPSNGHLGNFSLETLNTGEVAVDSVPRGPNTGLSYLADQPQLIGTGSTVMTHPVLYPPAPGTTWGNPEYQRWYNDQNGRPSGTCTQAHIPLMRQEVERHEGLTMASNSHLGVANTVFTTHRIDSTLEALYLYQSDSQRLRRRGHDLYVRHVRGPNRSAQRAFDNTDRPAILAKFPCQFDFNQMDN
jgi:hypothetical protein